MKMNINPKPNPQDRSFEFQSVVETITGIRYRQIKHNVIQNNAFTTTSKRVRKDIYSTFEKLKKLKLVIESKSIKNENTTNLVDIIKQDISGSTKQLTKLQEALKLNKINNQYMAHHNSAIMALQSMLGNMSSELKAMLEMKHQLMIQESNDQSNFETSYRNPPVNHSNSEHYKNVSNKETNSHVATTKFQSIYAPHDQYTQGYVQPIPGYSQTGYQPQQDQMLRHRTAPQKVNEMQGIEQTIVELGDIFQQLAEMVQEQEYVVNRIDSHVDMTQLNVEAAHGELTKYLRYISLNRAFYIKIFIVLILVFVGVLFILK